MPGKKIAQVKNEEQYETLRNKGYSKEKAARIANTEKTEKKDGKSDKYEERSKQELYDKAKKVCIQGRSKMSKKELIHALRNS